MKTNHTPGEWSCETGMVYDGNKRLLAKVYATKGEIPLSEGEANAKLIAAAPSLLNMLQRMVDESSNSATPCLLTLEHAREAIAQATTRRTELPAFKG